MTETGKTHERQGSVYLLSSLTEKSYLLKDVMEKIKC